MHQTRSFSYHVYHSDFNSIIQYVILTNVLGVVALQGCAEGWLDFRGSCYLHFAERYTWTDAEQRCQELNAHLVSISSQEEQQFVNCEYLFSDR